LKAKLIALDLLAAIRVSEEPKEELLTLVLPELSFSGIRDLLKITSTNTRS